MYRLFVSRTSLDARRTKNANKIRTPAWNTYSRLRLFLHHAAHTSAAGVIARSAVADLHTFKNGTQSQSAVRTHRKLESQEIVYTLLHLKINEYERARAMSRSLFYLVSFHIFVVLRASRTLLAVESEWRDTRRPRRGAVRMKMAKKKNRILLRFQLWCCG